jgi:diaminohydroxyphosphoribosylaminopyrimidine deaminase/5-amino-6-(5-phosphoribosylamino)uracil reductase
MQKAIELAKNGAGYVSPNPLVGAVIVKNSQIIAEGYHRKYGGPHAEREVINKCQREDLSEAILYVTLEPCSHYGKQPPCTDLIIQSGIGKVFIASKDPNPNVSGNGTEILRNAGIEVYEGILENEAIYMNRFFMKHIITKRPYVMLKSAQTLDGFIALNSGESKWISCDESRKRAHLLRHEFDAVLIGSGTAIKDDPQLTVRNVPGRNPKRIVLDSELNLPVNLKMFNDEMKKNTIICTSIALSDSAKARMLSDEGINIVTAEKTSNGLKINEILNKLYLKHNIGSIMVEGGAKLFSTLLENDLADEIQLFIAPKIFGNGLKTFGYLEIDKIENAKQFKIISHELCGIDIHLIMTK